MKNILTPAFTALTLVLAAASPAQAFNPQPDPPGRWAMMGMVLVQTARLTCWRCPSRVLSAPPTAAGHRMPVSC
jgi:hypothetical protein